MWAGRHAERDLAVEYLMFLRHLAEDSGVGATLKVGKQARQSSGGAAVSESQVPVRAVCLMGCYNLVPSSPAF